MRNLLLVLFCSSNFLISQNDITAEKIVDDVLKKINTAGTIKVDFTNTKKTKNLVH